ncbi:MAG TPA: bifunctional phosphoglucose/phosphomannose isomerase [Candidatus Bathyarchaeia archaeon]|nr:bifunctional phosphoglucose/phosphomannose isomerase [Candidatus Bathyarchaeia archaeon]
MYHKILSKTFTGQRYADGGIVLTRKLGNIDRLSRLDPSGMLEAIDGFPEHFLEYGVYGKMVPRLGGRLSIDNIVLAGMGGSASAGDIILEWLRDSLKIPALLLREPDLPNFVGPRTLFVGISYSGKTLETLTAFRSANKRHAKLVGIGTGGTLASLCEKYRVSFVTVPPTIAPRAALPQLAVATASVLENVGVAPDLTRHMISTGKELVHLRQKLNISIPIANNPAKRLATSLRRGLVVIYALQRMSSVARRFKNQLAENSKLAAKCDLLPEAAHNEIEGWKDQSVKLTPLIIRDWEETRLEAKIIRAFTDTIRGVGQTRPQSVQIRATDSLSRLVSTVFFLDYVSAYLAILRGTDPTPTRLIKEYKRRLDNRG